MSRNQNKVRERRPVPLCELRLSPSEAQIISAGLRYIVFVYKEWRDQGIIPVAKRWMLVYREYSWELAGLDDSMMSIIFELNERSAVLSHRGGRLRSFQPSTLEACILAVRIARKYKKHGHLKNTLTNFDECCRLFLCKLEKYRKRQKRAIISLLGRKVYIAEHFRWQRFVQIMRVTLLRCSCGTEFMPHLFKIRKQWIDTLQKRTAAELKHRGSEIPPTKELRRLLRLMLRYIRRGRTGFDVRYLLEKSWFAEYYCANFIEQRFPIKLGSDKAFRSSA